MQITLTPITSKQASALFTLQVLLAGLDLDNVSLSIPELKEWYISMNLDQYSNKSRSSMKYIKGFCVMILTKPEIVNKEFMDGFNKIIESLILLAKEEE